MSILFALLVLQVQPVPSASPLPNDDIVVIGKRMRRLKIVTTADRKGGPGRCEVRRSSGDPAFDSLLCDTTLVCAKTVTTLPQMKACLAPHIEGYARMLKARRDAAIAAGPVP